MSYKTAIRLTIAFAVFAVLAFLVGLARGAQNVVTPTPPPDSQVQVKRPVFHLDVRSNVKDLDPVSTAFLKPVIDGLSKTYDLRPDRALADEGGFELRVSIVNKKHQYFVTAILVAKLRNQSTHYFVFSAIVVLSKDNATTDGEAVFKGIDANIDNFLITISQPSEQ